MTEKAKDQLTEKEQLEGKIAGIKKEIDDLKNVVDLDEKQIGMESIEKKILDLQQEIEATTLVDSEKQELIIFLENSSGELTDLKSEVIENSVDESQIEEQKPEEEKKNFFGRSRDWIKGSWVGRHPWWSAGMAAVAGWGIWRIFKKSDKEDEKNNGDSKNGDGESKVEKDAEKNDDVGDETTKQEESSFWKKVWDKIF